jgi:hypothetical protein
MKKFIITTCGAIVIGLLMISTATAVPKVNSDPVMNIISEIEKNKKIIEEEISNKTLDLKTRESISLLVKRIKDTIYNVTSTLKIGDLIDLLIKIIQWLVTFIQKLVNLINLISSLAELIYNLVNTIVTLYNLILKIIDLIKSLFPSTTFKAT